MTAVVMKNGGKWTTFPPSKIVVVEAHPLDPFSELWAIVRDKLGGQYSPVGHIGKRADGSVVVTTYGHTVLRGETFVALGKFVEEIAQ